jgi:hypothetical protein
MRKNCEWIAKGRTRKGDQNGRAGKRWRREFGRKRDCGKVGAIKS